MQSGVFDPAQAGGNGFPLDLIFIFPIRFPFLFSFCPAGVGRARRQAGWIAAVWRPKGQPVGRKIHRRASWPGVNLIAGVCALVGAIVQEQRRLR